MKFKAPVQRNFPNEAAVAAENRRKDRTAWLMISASYLHFLGMTLGLQSENQIWLQHYGSNFAQNAKACGVK